MFLFEDVALSKGCQRIYNNASTVKSIAQTLKDEAEFHPGSFPSGIAKKILKAPDERAAHWFLEQLDIIEKRGYEGTVYSRDGADADWITRTFITGASNFEDILGNLNMILRDWYLLKNRNMLEPQHAELSRFRSITQLGAIITQHYGDQIEEIRTKAAKTAEQKSAKSMLLVDNDDYKIYIPFNRKASCLLGDKAKWCTANSEYDTHFHSYANRAMLFIVMPYYVDAETGKKTLKPQEVEITQGPRKGSFTRTNEKFQFDSASGDFMDITNQNVNPKIIAEKFPYLYSDVERALKAKKPEIEEALKAMSEDPTLQNADTKTKNYDISKQIADLEVFRKKGHFTDKIRPKEQSAKNNNGLHSVWEPGMGPHSVWKQGMGPHKDMAMESIRELARLMLEGKYPNDEEELEEDDAATDPESQGIGGSLGSTGGGSGDSTTKYAPGTAPSMPESHNIIGNEIMENNVDKDVAAMLSSLKKLDKLTESCAPVLMARPKLVNEEDKHKPEWLEKAEKKAEKKEDVKEDAEDNPWKKLAKKEEPSSHSGKTVKTSSGVRHERDYDAKDDKKGNIDGDDDLNEGVDPEVIAWMKRFAALGNMKGYGR